MFIMVLIRCSNTELSQLFSILHTCLLYTSTCLVHDEYAYGSCMSFRFTSSMACVNSLSVQMCIRDRILYVLPLHVIHGLRKLLSLIHIQMCIRDSLRPLLVTFSLLFMYTVSCFCRLRQRSVYAVVSRPAYNNVVRQLVHPSCTYITKFYFLSF